MAKDSTPRADALREQREARYGHLQATAERPIVVVDPDCKVTIAIGVSPPKPARKRVKPKRKIA